MKVKKVLTVVLIIALVFANGSVAFGLESTIASDNVDTTGEVTDVTTDSSIETEESTTSDAVQTDELATNDAIELQGTSKQNITVKAATHFVKVMSNSGVLTNAGNPAGYSSIAEASTDLNNMYSGSNTTYGNYRSNAGLVVTDTSGKVVNMKVGMAYFKSSAATKNVGSSYVTPKDALHYYYADSSYSKSVVGINGAVGTIANTELILVPGSIVNVSGFYFKDYYTKSSGGDLYHYVYKIKTPTTGSPYKSGTGCTSSYSVHTIDKAPAWMKAGTKYYSGNGITFYTDIGLNTKAGTHYSYYQYLPYRTMSDYTSTNLNAWINYKTASTSKLRSQGRNFINAQNRYGVNSVNEVAFASLESAYGTSSFAKTRNNLFGINAVDSNPGNAYGFSSVRVCINEHANTYLSRKYGNVKSDFRYFGLAPGNKAVGVNVKYASDPWHGEKISGIAYAVDKYLGSKDYRKFTVGVTNKNSVSVYKSAGSTYLYNLSNKSTGAGPTGIPVVILGSSGSYYMIQSELPISGNAASYSYTYYYSNSIAYVKKSDITVINNGSRNYTTEIASNRDLRNITVKVGSKNYFSGFNPGVTSYTVKVPKNTKTIKINGTRLMTTSTVTGNGTKKLNKKTKTYKVKVKSQTGSTKTYTIKVVPNGASSFSFGVYNSKTKLSNKSKKGKRTKASRPMKVQTKVKTNTKKTTVKMVIYNSKKKVVAQKSTNIYKTKTVKFTWNGKYTKHNKLKKKSGKYATYSKKGTKYYVRIIASRSGKTHKGKYHTFYLYK